MEFLRDTGKHFTVSYMLQKESVQSRMEAGISYTEFSYMLIQAYDFWHLFQSEGCELQMGGSDQWGNITAGHLAGRQARAAGRCTGWCSRSSRPRAAPSSARARAGNVWLDPERTSPYHFYQFWLNTDDRDVERYLKLFTFLPLDQIAGTMADHAADPGPAGGAARAGARGDRHRARRRRRRRPRHPDQRRPVRRRGRGELPAEALADMPERRVSRTKLPDGLPVIEVLVASGLASSKADARRGIQGKGFYLNGRPIDDVELRLGEDALQGPPEERFVILRKGKKNYVRLVHRGLAPTAARLRESSRPGACGRRVK